jgi:hypothetical protein
MTTTTKSKQKGSEFFENTYWPLEIFSPTLLSYTHDLFMKLINGATIVLEARQLPVNKTKPLPS